MHLVSKAFARLFSAVSPRCPSYQAPLFWHSSITTARSLSRKGAITSMSTSSSSIVDETLFWNREDAAAASSSSSSSLASNPQQPIVKHAKIISLADPNDLANDPLHKLLKRLPQQQDGGGFELLQIGTCLEELDVAALQEAQANVVFVTGGSSSMANVRETLGALCREIPTLEWIHARSAGIDFCTSSSLQDWWQPGQQRKHEQQLQARVMTNAKGQFSSTLAEYTLMACAYFAKDLPRLLRNKQNQNWDRYPVLELRGATMGIVGYGDIGKACAKLAKAYGMHVKALQRRCKSQDGNDAYCDEILYMDTENKSNKTALNQIFADCDYILCALPQTPDTLGMIGKEQFDQVKPGACFINVGRGPVVDEQALIAALQSSPATDDSGRGRLRGAGLDVFSQEPLPKDSPLWTMDNVLLSPHNMDLTATFMEEATQFFVDVNLPRFVRGLPLLNPVNPVDGY